jgi:hypothetical protein
MRAQVRIKSFRFGIVTALRTLRVLACSGRTPIKSEIQQKLVHDQLEREEAL